MFQRKIMNEIQEWKKRNEYKKQALIIKGLRQVGKTYIADYFARENYKSVIYINFKSNPEYKNIFSGSLEVDQIKASISLNILNSRFIDNETVIILDELQECNNARTALKNFCIDGRYDVICTGSLLGIRGYNRELSSGPSIGYEYIIEMYAMDFEEFLLAIGVQDFVIENIRKTFNKKGQFEETVHNNLSRYFREYICVGGMPAVVEEYVRNHDFQSVRKLQRNLMENYRDDFGKRINASGKEETDYSLLTKINAIFNCLPSQLAKENNKFTYKDIEKGARKSTHETAIQWLIDYGLVAPCYNLKNLQLPLQGNKDIDNYKLYFTDTGLFISQLEEGTVKEIIEDTLRIYKGAIYENIVADAFHKNSKDLFFYRKDSGLEIDFISVIEGQLSAIEVKARSGKSKSLNEVLNNDKYDVHFAYKLTSSNISVETNKLILPHYLAFLLK